MLANQQVVNHLKEKVEVAEGEVEVGAVEVLVEEVVVEVVQEVGVAVADQVVEEVGLEVDFYPEVGLHEVDHKEGVEVHLEEVAEVAMVEAVDMKMVDMVGVVVGALEVDKIMEEVKMVVMVVVRIMEAKEDMEVVKVDMVVDKSMAAKEVTALDKGVVMEEFKVVAMGEAKTHMVEVMVEVNRQVLVDQEVTGIEQTEAYDAFQ